MGSLSIWHWLIVLAVVILVFGTKKLKNLGSDLGGAVKGFKDGMKESGQSPAEDAPVNAAVKPQVTQAAVEKTTIDVEARTKS